MMGNLSPVRSSTSTSTSTTLNPPLTLTVFLRVVRQNLKSHAVTMFEVGKLSDETLDSFLAELEKVRSS